VPRSRRSRSSWPPPSNPRPDRPAPGAAADDPFRRVSRVDAVARPIQRGAPGDLASRPAFASGNATEIIGDTGWLWGLSDPRWLCDCHSLERTSNDGCGKAFSSGTVGLLLVVVCALVVNAECDHEQLLATEAIGQLSEEQRAEARPGDIDRGRRSDPCDTQLDAAARLRQTGGDTSDDRDLQPVQDSDGAQTENDPPMKARPRQPVQARRDPRLDGGGLHRAHKVTLPELRRTPPDEHNDAGAEARLPGLRPQSRIV
jgi:hypothetical protein